MSDKEIENIEKLFNETDVSQKTEPVSPTVVPPEETESIPPIPPSSSQAVVVSRGENIPKLFYLILGVTLVIFLGMTILLYSTLTKKGESNKSSISPTVSVSTPTIAAISPTIVSSPAAATDSALIKLEKLGTSDEVGEIEKDLTDTDFSPLEESLKAISD
jgi:hypothetical protein